MKKCGKQEKIGLQDVVTRSLILRISFILRLISIENYNFFNFLLFFMIQLTDLTSSNTIKGMNATFSA